MNNKNNFIKLKVIGGAVLCVVLFVLGYIICYGYENSMIKPYSEDRKSTVSESSDSFSFEIKAEEAENYNVVPENSENIDTNHKIDINTAGTDRLMLLKGIGEATARKIVVMRYEIGGFLYIEDLMNVSGIGEKTFEKIKDKIYASEIDEDVRNRISSYAGFVKRIKEKEEKENNK